MSDPKYRQRLAPILAQLDRWQESDKTSTVLDLCALLEMFAERMEGMVKYTSPRLVVHIKTRAAGERRARQIAESKREAIRRARPVGSP